MGTSDMAVIGDNLVLWSKPPLAGLLAGWLLPHSSHHTASPGCVGLALVNLTTSLEGYANTPFIGVHLFMVSLKLCYFLWYWNHEIIWINKVTFGIMYSYWWSVWSHVGHIGKVIFFKNVGLSSIYDTFKQPPLVCEPYMIGHWNSLCPSSINLMIIYCS